jgi:hypothetical protein
MGFVVRNRTPVIALAHLIRPAEIIAAVSDRETAIRLDIDANPMALAVG